MAGVHGHQLSLSRTVRPAQLECPHWGTRRLLLTRRLLESAWANIRCRQRRPKAFPVEAKSLMGRPTGIQQAIADFIRVCSR